MSDLSFMLMCGDATYLHLQLSRANVWPPGWSFPLCMPVTVKGEGGCCSYTQGAFHWDIWRPASDQLSTGTQWNAFGWLVGYQPAAEKCRDQKLGCVVGASDTIMFSNGYHRNEPEDRWISGFTHLCSLDVQRSHALFIKVAQCDTVKCPCSPLEDASLPWSRVG